MFPTVQSSAIDGIAWSILGQTYTPLQRGESCMAWHADFPDGTFVPPHIHHAQDEFLYILSGVIEVETAKGMLTAGAGAVVSLPRGAFHGLFNRSGAGATCLFWVTPAASLWDLFVAIDGVPDPGEVVRLAALHGITFLPPG